MTSLVSVARSMPLTKPLGRGACAAGGGGGALAHPAKISPASANIDLVNRNDCAPRTSGQVPRYNMYRVRRRLTTAKILLIT
jgi:hypothetical protein